MKLVSLMLSFLLLFQQSGFAQVAAQLDLAGHLAQLHQSITVDKFRPLTCVSSPTILRMTTLRCSWIRAG